MSSRNLGQGRLTVLFEYPAPEAALARTKAGRSARRRALRGLCLRRRTRQRLWRIDRRRRAARALRPPRWTRSSGATASAIRSTRIFSPRSRQMPEASGVALGFDRLVMLATGATRIDQVVWTPPAGERMTSVVQIEAAAATLRSAGRAGRARPGAGRRSRRRSNEVAARYAVAVTAPMVAALIDPDDPHDPIARQFIPSAEELVDAAERARRSDRRRARIRRSPASCIAIPTACCSSWCMSARCIAGSASAARWSGRARTARCRRSAYRGGARLHPRASAKSGK